VATVTQAFTPTASVANIPAGTTPTNVGLSVMAADFTPQASGLVLVTIGLDLVLNQTDSVAAGLWVVSPLASFANNTRIDAGGASSPIQGAATAAGLTVTPALTTGTFAARGQQNIPGPPFEDNLTLTAALQLTPGTRYAIGVQLSTGLGTTTIVGRMNASFIEQPTG
jgi:hypothetical protein